MTEIDQAIDDLIEAAALPEERREFELRVRRRNLIEQIDRNIREVQKAAHYAAMFGAG